MQGEKLTPPRALIQGWVCMRRMCAAGEGEGTLEFAPFHKEGLVPWLHFAVCRRPAARRRLRQSFNSALGREGRA